MADDQKLIADDVRRLLMTDPPPQTAASADDFRSLLVERFELTEPQARNAAWLLIEQALAFPAAPSDLEDHLLAARLLLALDLRDLPAHDKIPGLDRPASDFAFDKGKRPYDRLDWASVVQRKVFASAALIRDQPDRTPSRSRWKEPKNYNITASTVARKILALMGDEDEMTVILATARSAPLAQPGADRENETSTHGHGQLPRAGQNRRFSRVSVVLSVAAAVGVATIATTFWALTHSFDESTRAAVNSKTLVTTPPQENTTFWSAGWGPERPTFTVDKPASYPAFNSFTDNPNIGDERNFVGVRHKNSSRIWFDDIWAEPGDTLLMRVYVNNAGGSVPGVDVPQESIQGARVQIGLSKREREFAVGGVLTADNAKTVWDGATIHTDENVDVAMDVTTAKVETNAGDRKLSPAAFSPEGALLGLDAPDGVVGPLFADAEYVVVTLRVVKAAPTDDHTTDPSSGGEQSELDARYDGGWGPERQIFTIERPADYTVLNSITNNPAVGDERNFVQIKRLGDDNLAYTDITRGNVGDEFVVYAYVGNDAADNLGMAAAVHGLTAQLRLPSPGTDLSVAVTYSGANAAPVWDGASVITPVDSQLSYVEGSASFQSAAASGTYRAKDDEGFGSGETMLLGYRKQDGDLPIGTSDSGQAIGSGYLTFRIRVVPLTS